MITKLESADEEAVVNDLIQLIQKHRENAYRKINEELVTLYYEIGKYLYAKVKNEKWGSKVVEDIANKIKNSSKGIKGFGRRSLYQMMQFYETYNNSGIVQTLLAQISWSNHLQIMSRTKTMHEKEFYIRLCIQNNYSSREINRQITSCYYQRYMLSKGKALESLEKAIDEDDIPNSKILDINSLEFLDLPNSYTEKDLRKAIVHNLKDFILEIGKDFSFIGEEYRIQVGDKDFYIDLLFYNRNFNCLVAFELKIDEFKPEYISKMDFYLEALDRQERKCTENPSVGIILCASKNQTIVEYSISRSVSPIKVSEYSTKLIDKKLLETKLIELNKFFEK